VQQHIGPKGAQEAPSCSYPPSRWLLGGHVAGGMPQLETCAVPLRGRLALAFGLHLLVEGARLGRSR